MSKIVFILHKKNSMFAVCRLPFAVYKMFVFKKSPQIHTIFIKP